MTVTRKYHTLPIATVCRDSLCDYGDHLHHITDHNRPEEETTSDESDWLCIYGCIDYHMSDCPTRGNYDSGVTDDWYDYHYENERGC